LRDDVARGVSDRDRRGALGASNHRALNRLNTARRCGAAVKGAVPDFVRQKGRMQCGERHGYWRNLWSDPDIP
jgi:hypothetical protein